FLPEAMVNYLARLGWAHGDQEVFTREELIRLFDLRQVGATPAIFDRTKLEWLNQVWMKRFAGDPKTREDLADRFSPYLLPLGVRDPAKTLLVNAVTHLATRATTLVEMAPKARFYFEDPKEYDATALGKLAGPAFGPRLDRLIARLAALEPWTDVDLEGACRQLASELGVKLVDLAQPMRLALTGETASPPVFAIMAALGPETTLRRLRALRARVPRA
ncbi:MAG: glutamate--tRNA ligase family protein, partial [Thermoanaerobaculia bacterium]